MYVPLFRLHILNHHGNQNQRTILSPTGIEQHIHIQAMLLSKACGETDRFHSEPLKSMQLLDNKQHTIMFISLQVKVIHF